MVVKDYLEARFEKIFSRNSYGYRPDRNAHQSIDKVWSCAGKTDWVIDLDIKGFFDNIDHDLLDVSPTETCPRKVVSALYQTVAKYARANAVRRTDLKARQRNTTGRSNKPTVGQFVSTLRHG